MQANGPGPVSPNGQPLSGLPTDRSERRTGKQVRSGPFPQLALGFSMRPESVPGLAQALAPGGAVVLVPAQPSPVPAWQEATGKTQVALCAAQSVRWPGGLDLVAWVAAASRASVSIVAPRGRVPLIGRGMIRSPRVR